MNSKKKLSGVLSVLLVFTIIATSTITAFGASGKWIKSGNRWWYRHADSSYTTNGWEKINNKWYHFDSKGWMQTGWIKVKGQWYYLNSSGDMATGWKKVKGVWYYLNANGSMAIGWKQVKGTWYYLDDDGSMIEDSFIYFEDGTAYYLKSNGAMATRWYEIDGDWYYFGSSGSMVYNKWVGNNYVNHTGIWVEDTKIPVDNNTGAMAIARLYNLDTDNMQIKYTDDEKLISQFISYLSQLKPTEKQKATDIEGWIYDYLLYTDMNSEEPNQSFLIFENEGLLYCEENDVFYDINTKDIQNIWNSSIVLVP